MIERIPPHSEEAERSVLGAVMLKKEALYDVLEVLKAEDFYSERHKEIYSAVRELYMMHSAVDFVTVCDRLKDRKTLEMVGGRAYVAELTSDVPSAANAVEYAKIISEKSMIRQMIAAADEISERGYSAKVDARDMLDIAESSIFSIAQSHQRKDYAKIQDVFLENISRIDDAARNRGKLRGVTTGFKRLDEISNGLQAGDLVIVAARPSMGKTAFALNIAQNAAMKGKASVLIFSLEMSKEQLGERMLSTQASVESDRLQKGTVDREDWEHLNKSLDDMNDMKMFIDDTSDITVMEMRNKCRRLKAEIGKLDLIVVDYIQIMVSHSTFENRQQEVSKISRELKQLAREMECPVLALSQLSRGPEQRPDHRPNLADLRESGAIEQDADMVMLLYRDEYYNKEDSEKPGICEVIIAKNRRGKTDTVDLTWVARYTKFSDQAL